MPVCQGAGEVQFSSAITLSFHGAGEMLETCRTPYTWPQTARARREPVPATDVSFSPLPSWKWLTGLNKRTILARPGPGDRGQTHRGVAQFGSAHGSGS